jgi:hypothetical protein
LANEPPRLNPDAFGVQDYGQDIPRSEIGCALDVPELRRSGNLCHFGPAV